MAVVWIPALLRHLTGGEARITVPGETVRQLIANLDEKCPGIEARLCEEGRLRPGISVVVDGQVSSRRLRHQLTDSSEVHFLPAVSGGERGQAQALPSIVRRSGACPDRSCRKATTIYAGDGD